MFDVLWGMSRPGRGSPAGFNGCYVWGGFYIAGTFTAPAFGAYLQLKAMWPLYN